MAVALSVEGVSKVYRIYPSQKARLLEALTRRRRHREVWALREVSFELRAGRSLGLVGENGAGKSTLLKILTGCAFPSSGVVRKEGKVAAILELGMGFHGEFSGRDNAGLNAALLGLAPAEVRRAVPQILEFSELGPAFDQPLKTYSSGMVMRLAFSTAIHVNPDILIIDEALAVGDGYFQKKCIEALRAFQDQEKTVVLCSHALYYIASLCREAVWLKEGRVQRQGNARDVVMDYENHLNSRKAPGRPRAEERPTPARIVGARLLNARGEAADRFAFQEPFAAELEIATEDPRLPLRPGLVLFRNDEVEIFTSTSFDHPPLQGRSLYRCRVEMDRLPLVKGMYKPAFFLTDPEGLHVYHIRELPDGLEVVPPPDYRFFGIIHPATRWILDME